MENGWISITNEGYSICAEAKMVRRVAKVRGTEKDVCSDEIDKSGGFWCLENIWQAQLWKDIWGTIYFEFCKK